MRLLALVSLNATIHLPCDHYSFANVQKTSLLGNKLCNRTLGNSNSIVGQSVPSDIEKLYILIANASSFVVD
jgi:hypothetical protein